MLPGVCAEPLRHLLCERLCWVSSPRLVVAPAQVLATVTHRRHTARQLRDAPGRGHQRVCALHPGQRRCGCGLGDTHGAQRWASAAGALPTAAAQAGRSLAGPCPTRLCAGAWGQGARHVPLQRRCDTRCCCVGDRMQRHSKLALRDALYMLDTTANSEKRIRQGRAQDKESATLINHRDQSVCAQEARACDAAWFHVYLASRTQS